MGINTGKQPEATDTFLWRICHAIDEKPWQLARNIGVRVKDITPLLDDKHMLAEIDRSEIWWKIAEHVNHRLAMLLAVKTEMDRQLQRERASRAVRHAHMRQREKKPSPR